MFFLLITNSCFGDASLIGATQLDYIGPDDLTAAVGPELVSLSPALEALPQNIPGRQIPAVVSLKELNSPNLASRAIPLPLANTLAHIHFQRGRFGVLQTKTDPSVELFNPECVLVEFRGAERVAVLRVEPQNELAAVRLLDQRPDVEFSELDIFETRQFVPDDPQITNQWQHEIIGSYHAWDISRGKPFVRIAIVDQAFQTDHPDLAANVVEGWDVVLNNKIKAGRVSHHATMSAGMAAAIINNGKGVAGAGNCKILPLNINGAISEMYNATVWAADHDVRVVNISWSGANMDTLEAAGKYLKEKTGGILVMAAIDGLGRLNWTNQPDIWTIAMTDAADNLQSRFGPHVDFAAPGYKVYSTGANGGYAFGSGTSYAAPLFSGVVGVLFSINPLLQPDEVIDILKRTARQPGKAPWNEYFGWGRINFAVAAEAAAKPLISQGYATNGQVVIAGNFTPGFQYTLLRAPAPQSTNWESITNAIIRREHNLIQLIDPHPLDKNDYYQIHATVLQ